MANPQREDGHIDIANEIADHLMKIRIPGEERQIFDCIMRQTWGYLKLRHGKPYKDKNGLWVKKQWDTISRSQFIKLTGLSGRTIERALQNLLSKNLIRKDASGFICKYGIQKDWEKWKLPAKKQVVIKPDAKMHQNSDAKKQNTKEKKEKENIYSLFQFWNSLKIIQHRKIGQCESALKSALKEFSKEEITEAMQNYKTVLGGKEYFWSYKWTLKEFLKRGLERFLTVNTPFENFRKKEERKKQMQKDNWKSLQEAKKELEVSSSEERILKWLNILPEKMHGYLAAHLRRVYPRGNSYDKAKIKYEKEKRDT